MAAAAGGNRRDATPPKRGLIKEGARGSHVGCMIVRICDSDCMRLSDCGTAAAATRHWWRWRGEPPRPARAPRWRLGSPGGFKGPPRRRFLVWSAFISHLSAASEGTAPRLGGGRRSFLWGPDWAAADGGGDADSSGASGTTAASPVAPPHPASTHDRLLQRLMLSLRCNRSTRARTLLPGAADRARCRAAAAALLLLPRCCPRCSPCSWIIQPPNMNHRFSRRCRIPRRTPTPLNKQRRKTTATPTHPHPHTTNQQSISMRSTSKQQDQQPNNQCKSTA